MFFAGVSRLMDLLADSREVIRNDVSTEVLPGPLASSVSVPAVLGGVDVLSCRA